MAVIVNESGDVALDGQLVVGTTEEIVELTDGCVCCTVRGDLVAAVTRLLARRKAWFRPLRFERLIIETSGLASPGPVVQTFLLDPVLSAETRVDGVIAVASAADLARALELHPLSIEQLAVADAVVLNHVDRADADAAETLVRAHNPTAPLWRAHHADVDVGPLLDLGGHDAARWQMAATSHVEAAHVTLSTDRPVDLPRLKVFLQFVAARRTWTLWRLKGLFHCSGLQRAVVAHGVFQWLQLGPGAMAAPTTSTLVLIGRDFDRAEIERGWAVVVGG